MDSGSPRRSEAIAVGADGVTYPPVQPGTLVRLGAKLVATASVLAGRAAIGLGIRAAPEGWRRTAGLLLRSEATRFALSAFGLRVPERSGNPGRHPDTIETGTAQALRSFLHHEPDAHYALEWRRPVTIRRRVPFVDVVVLRFAGDGRLDAILPYLASGGPDAPPADVRSSVHTAVVTAYNRTALLPEVERTRQLLADVRGALGSAGTRKALPGALAYAERLLSACCLSFEQQDPTDPARRFTPPAFAARRALGFGCLSWVARTNDERCSVDLWVSAHHVGLDGVPLQDLLNRLERSWGAAEAVSFPPPDAGMPFAGPNPCHAPGERPVDQVITFVDLSFVLALRRELNVRYGSAIGGEATVGALLAWLLSQEPEFAGVRIASTVDVAASGRYERDVDVVSLRPADFGTGDPPWSGFVEFAREFNRLVTAARTRSSPVRIAMQMTGLIPAWAHAAMVRADPASLDETFGSLCVTIIRDARVFIAPMTDLGLGHGFFAVGSTNLPSAAGGRLTCVSIKGDAGRIAHYPGILQRMIERSALLREALAQGA